MSNLCFFFNLLVHNLGFLLSLKCILGPNLFNPLLLINHLLNQYIRNGQVNEAKKVFNQNPKSRDTVSWNTMISGYAKINQLKIAQEMFDEMPQRDVVSWNSMLAGFQRVGDSGKVFQYFVQMGRNGMRPTEFTFATVISVNSDGGLTVLIPQIHAHAVKLALSSSVFVGSALIGGYAKLGCHITLRALFDEICMKDVSSWNALISGYMEVGCVLEGFKVFDAMPEKNVVSWTSLINGYIHNKQLDEARLNFEQMPEKNVVTWTVMISGYERNGKFLEALDLFISMWKSGIRPNECTFSSIVSACAGCSSLVFGKQVHLNILKSGVRVDVVLLSSLVDMYGKCGDISSAVGVFESIKVKNEASCNSIIGGYARNGYGIDALNEFERMKELGLKPDQITFVNLLSACVHGGLVQEGETYFESMEREYGIKPEKEHYACMVDLFGRAGQLEKAEKLIRSMPIEPDVVVWGALLGACGVYSCLEFGCLEFGSSAAEAIHNLEQDHPAVYLMLSKIHGDKGVWTKVTELRKLMKQTGAKKQTASSWIES